MSSPDQAVRVPPSRAACLVRADDPIRAGLTAWQALRTPWTRAAALAHQQLYLRPEPAPERGSLQPLEVVQVVSGDLAKRPACVAAEIQDGSGGVPRRRTRSIGVRRAARSGLAFQRAPRRRRGARRRSPGGRGPVSRVPAEGAPRLARRGRLRAGPGRPAHPRRR